MLLRPFIATVALGFAIGCSGGPPRSLDWQLRFRPPSIAVDVVAVHLEIRREGCDGEVVWEQDLRSEVALEGMQPPLLDAGRYGFAAVARSAACEVVASGCAPIALPAASGSEVTTVLEAACDEPPCDADACAGDAGLPSVDAGGAPDAGPADAGGLLDVDPSTDAGDLPDVGPSTDAAGCPAGCPAGRTCDGSSCVCVAGTTECGDACVDTDSDASHCGGCGRACEVGEVCSDGGCGPAPTTWSTTARDHDCMADGVLGTRFRYLCPPEGAARSAWGTDVYTNDSSICTAAAHVGRITVEAGGEVVIVMEPGRDAYVGSTRHGITTRDWPAWSCSFSFP